MASALDLVDRRDEEFRERGVRPAVDGNERLIRHQQRSREALGLLLVVARRAGSSRVDRMAVQAQRGDEAPLGVVGLEHLDVRGVVDALGGQGGETTAVKYDAHMGL